MFIFIYLKDFKKGNEKNREKEDWLLFVILFKAEKLLPEYFDIAAELSVKILKIKVGRLIWLI